MAMLTSSFVRPIMPEEFLPSVEAFHKQMRLFEIFGQPTPYAGMGDSIRFSMNVGASSISGGAIDEDGVLPDVDDSTHVELAVANQTYAEVGKISKEAMAEGRGALESVYSDRTADLVSKVDSGLISVLEASVNSTGTYGGLTRTSYAAGLVSHYEDTDTAITEAYLNAALQFLLTPVSVGRRKTKLEDIVILCDTDLFFLLQSVVTPAAGNPYIQQGGSFDGGLTFFGRSVPTWNTIPVVVMDGMTTGTLLMGDKSTIEIKESIPVNVEEMGKTNLSQKFAVNWRGNLVNKEPSQWARLVNKD